jgi:hypothetical protein
VKVRVRLGDGAIERAPGVAPVMFRAPAAALESAGPRRYAKELYA